MHTDAPKIRISRGGALSDRWAPAQRQAPRPATGATATARLWSGRLAAAEASVAVFPEGDVHDQPCEEIEPMGHQASYSIVIDRPVNEVWTVVRDFNSYPRWVDGVEGSRIEDGMPGTAVGAVRDFVMHGAHTRQRLVAHSDLESFFSYESCGPTERETDGVVHTMHHYRATVRLRSISEGDRCFAEWSSTYSCPGDDANGWARWWASSLPAWLGSLRDHVGG